MAEHPLWKTPHWRTTGVDAALFLFFPNEGPGNYFKYPEHPDIRWILTAGIHPRHRADLRTALGELGFPVRTLFQVEWWKWRSRLAEPLGEFGESVT